MADLGSLFGVQSIAGLLQPRTIASIQNPSNLPLSEFQAAAISQSMADRELQKGQLGLSTLAQLQKAQQDAIVSQQREREIDMNAQRLAVDAAKSEADRALTGIETRQKALDFGKAKMLMDAATQGGPEGYLQVLQSLDPDKHADIMKKQIDIQTAILGQNKSIFDLEKDKRDLAVKQYSDLGNILEQVALAGPNAKAVYGKSLPIIKTIMPNAPNDYDEAFVDAGLIHSGAGLQTFHKAGAFSPIDKALLPKEVQEGLVSQFGGSSDSGQTTPGAITSADQKSQFADILDTSKGIQAIPGQPVGGSARTAAKTAQAKDVIDSVNDIQELLKGTDIPLETLLPNFLKTTKGQKLNSAISSLQDGLGGLAGGDTGPAPSPQLVQPSDTLETLQYKLYEAGEQAQRHAVEMGLNPTQVPKISTGLVDPDTKKAVTYDDLRPIADKYGISLIEARDRAKQLLLKGKK